MNTDLVNQKIPPPMTEPMISLFGCLALTKEADLILDRNWQPPQGLDPYAIKLYQELYMPEPICKSNSLPTEVTSKDHCKSWRKQKENISSSPSGPHFGHCKASIEDASLAKFDAKLRSLPYNYGFAPESWKQIVDVEIPKKAGVCDIDKMRTITLMHSELNINNKKLGREVMRHAESNGTLAREQGGCRKRHQDPMEEKTHYGPRENETNSLSIMFKQCQILFRSHSP